MVAVGGLVAMAMLTLLVGRSTPDTRSSTTVIAAPERTTPPRTSASATPGQIATPWGGQGWPGQSWYDIHKGQ